MTHRAGFPTRGVPPEQLLAELRANRHDDAPWREGRIFSLIYHPGDPVLKGLLAATSREYLAENALNPKRFPSLAQLERESADLVAALLHGIPDAGGLTSGGTESIFVAVSVARTIGREQGITNPEIVTGQTAHPAFAKACHLLGVKQTRVAVGADKRVNVEAMRAAIGPDTVLVVASAPNYPYGVIDPVTEIAAIAQESDTLCHVDACLGGMLLPFWERLGEPVPPWDFRVPGVTSISADIHKYGYAFKGASALIWRTPELWHKQLWVDDNVWGGGLYASSTPAGTRPAPPIAGAWVSLRYHGEAGYLARTREVRDATRQLIMGLTAIDGLQLVTEPDAAIFQFWLNRTREGLHLMVSPYHLQIVDELLAEIGMAVEVVRREGITSQDKQASYSGTL